MKDAAGTRTLERANRREATGPKGEGRDSPSNFPKYPEYKDSGVEWLGEVPAHWEVSRLKFCGELITGITPPSEDLSNYSAAGWPWVRPDDLDDQGAPVQATKFLTDQGWSYCRPVASMSTLVCCIGSIGKLGFTTEMACTNQQITAVQPFYDARFLFYLIYASKPELDLRATGNVLRILNAERLGNVPAVMPPIDESAQIATFLDHETARIDALVEEQQRLIELLKEKRQAVISHAVTKGLDPDVPMKDSEVEWLGEVPSEWVVSKLGYFFAEPPCYGVLVPDYDADGVPMLRITDMESEHIDSTGLTTISPALSRQYSRTIVQEGDVVLSLVGTIGKAFEVTQRLEGVNLSRAIARLQLKVDALPRYLCWIFQSEAFSRFTDLVCRGTAQRVLNISDLTAFLFAFPPYGNQAEISAFLDKETTRIDILVKEGELGIKLLQERRSALISAAVTGKIDVRGWQPPAGSSAPAESTQTEMI